MSNIDYAPEVIRGAKRLQRAFYKSKLGPWENVITPWEFLTEAERVEFLQVAALFHAAEYLHDGKAEAVVADVVREIRPEVSDKYPTDVLMAYVSDRYAEYTNPYLDEDRHHV